MKELSFHSNPKVNETHIKSEWLKIFNGLKLSYCNHVIILKGKTYLSLFTFLL